MAGPNLVAFEGSAANSSIPVSATNPLPVTLESGSVTIGTVDIDQTTPGTTNGVVTNSGSVTTATIVGSAGADGSSTITLGGTAQNLFAGATPAHGYAIYNPDPTNDLWINEGAAALANGSGSIRVSANGGAYETPTGYKPFHAVSIVGAVTSQKFTARSW